MIPELYIVGAGGFGREMHGWLRDLAAWDQDWRLAGFLDDNHAALDGFDCAQSDCGYKVVAAASGFIPEEGQLFVCGIGNVAMKQKVCVPLLDRGAQFIRVVHPRAVVGANVSLGAGVVVCPGVVLSCDITVGDLSMINLNSTVGHDARIGQCSTISPLCSLTAEANIGDGVFLGSGAHILPGKSVGDGALVGAGSVVMRDVKIGQRVYGNPARAFATPSD